MEGKVANIPSTKSDNEIKSNKDKSKIYFFIVAIIALLATNVYFYVKYKSSGEKLYTLTLQKEKLQIEIDRIEAELDNIDRQNIQGLPQEVIDQQLKARQLIADLRRALEENNVSDSQIQLANSQLESLKSNVSKLLTEVDDLKLQNEILKKENVELQGTVKETTNKVQKLANDNSVLSEKVLIASSLKVSNIVINGVEQKKNGTLEIENRAKKADKLQIKFTIVDNPLAKKGRKEVFARVIDPQGNLIAASNDVFYVHGDKLQYTFKEHINFTNNGEEYTFLWNDQTKLKKGAYTVLLYADNAIMGRSSVVLK
ncbi:MULTISPECIES: hypothetical protein [Sphingobacterium]|uniref:Chromosome segregation protein SMC n=1 Tax=Sphingobacterium litopenaei TaxID=2763500 RepID=A0ABR7YAI5_9SPHI|nr:MULTISPECIES: hypothetical protein [Sphingobacterium]MBD1428295.1 hypothetical protein [Sphingobacterium litopenaei]NGM72160.1 hypothetical protein [Sphingobacterium sp. SGL-16]